MALYATISFTGDGTTTDFTVSFPYISTSYVKVYLDDVLSTAYTWFNSTTIRMTAAPASGVVVKIRRITPRNVRLVDFVDAGILTEADLDAAMNQLYYVLQESLDDADTAAITAGLYSSATYADAAETAKDAAEAAQTAAESAKTDSETAQGLAEDARDTALAILDNTAYGSGWNGVETKAPTKDAVYDIIHKHAGLFGSLSSFVQYTDNTATIPDSAVNKLIILGGSTNALTLPSPTSCETGSTLTFMSQGGSTVLTPSASNTLWFKTGYLSSLTISGSDELTLICANSIWSVVGGSILMSASSYFAKSFSTSGYQKLPTGLILQWGTTGSIDAGSSAAVTFPVTFPTAIVGYPICSIGGAPSVNNSMTMFLPTSLATTGFTANNTDSDSAAACAWFAIGY